MLSVGLTPGRIVRCALQAHPHLRLRVSTGSWTQALLEDQPVYRQPALLKVSAHTVREMPAGQALVAHWVHTVLVASATQGRAPALA